MAIKVDILDAQLQSFQQSQAGSVQDLCDQRVNARHCFQQALHFIARKDNRDVLTLSGPADLSQPRQLAVEHFAIQEQQGAQRLAMRRRRNVALIREMNEK